MIFKLVRASTTSHDWKNNFLHLQKDQLLICIGYADIEDYEEVGETIEGEIRNITEFGLFIGLSEDIDGLVHLSDLSWDGNGDELIKTYSKGTSVKTKILDLGLQADI